MTTLPRMTPDLVRELAIGERVCVRPLIREVTNRDTGQTVRVALPCGSTRESLCPPCAAKARILRMTQCAEGWHRTTDPDPGPEPEPDDDADDDTDGPVVDGDRRVRSTRRRQDTPDLPRIRQEATTLGREFAAPDGKTYRPSMFLTFTLPSYGKIRDGVPVDPDSYDYRRAALDALHFPKLVDRLWQNLRRVAGFKVQYFAAVEPQTRLAPHLHAAIRGTIPRHLIRAVAKATYAQIWWPSFDTPVFTDRVPVYDRETRRYHDPATGELLPTWDQAIDALDADPDARPVHVLRFGSQLDMAGIIAPSPDADRAIRYLTKYLTKAVSDPLVGDTNSPAREAHIDRLHDELRYLPCSPRCANWLRYGITPEHAGPGLEPGRCFSKAHDRECLGLGGRRVLVSRQWSGKTLREHRADRAAVVREALQQSGIIAPEVERMAADLLAADGKPLYQWRDVRVDPNDYTVVIFEAVRERKRWRTEYERARGRPVDNVSATHRPPDLAAS